MFEVTEKDEKLSDISMLMIRSPYFSSPPSYVEQEQ